jgi:hypothetical protein
MSFPGTRYRIVRDQDGREEVSSVVLGEDEIAEHLDYEATMHSAAGWNVTRLADGSVVASKLGVSRFIRARGFEPMADRL